jgi:3-methyladenine DNA glycosylase AlkD
MTADEVMTELKALGNEQQKKTFLRHGAKEPFFGVKIGDLKVIQKRVKKDHALALALYDTGNSDAMYLAALIAEPEKMTKPQLQKWVKKAYWHMLSQYTVAWVAAESRFATELALEWIDSPKELIAIAGWSTYASYVSITPDEDLDLDEIVGLLERVRAEIHGAQNLVKYAMNGFVIAVGGCVPALNAKAKAVAKAIGTVEVDMGDTDCKVPLAADYIAKVERAGKLGAKRKSAMC